METILLLTSRTVVTVDPSASVVTVVVSVEDEVEAVDVPPPPEGGGLPALCVPPVAVVRLVVPVPVLVVLPLSAEMAELTPVERAEMALMAVLIMTSIRNDLRMETYRAATLRKC